MNPLPWSYSALEKFDNCPKQFHEVRVTKRIIEPEGEEAKHGNIVHKHIENALKDKAPLPPTHKYLHEYVEAIRARPGTLLVENQMALNKALQPCPYFGDKDVWVRGKADVIQLDGEIAYGMDHKTGKRKVTDQMVLMALMIFYHHPQIQRVRVAFNWLKTDEIDKAQFDRAQIPEMWEMFLPRLAQYKEAFDRDLWQPRQSGLCHGWCPVKDCEYWRPKRVRTRP